MGYWSSDLVKGKFGRWLDNNMCTCRKNCREVADALHLSYNTVRYHRTGERLPTFPDVVAYCWFFVKQCVPNIGSPEEVWEAVQKDREEFSNESGRK